MFLDSIALSQINISSNKLSLPKNMLFSEFSIFNLKRENEVEKLEWNSFFNLSFNYQLISNSGHANIDNSAEIYSSGASTRLVSTRLAYFGSWLVLELEPYVIFQSKPFNNELVHGTYQLNNNHGSLVSSKPSNTGLKQSRIIMHYNGIGFSYGRMSHWWSPGFHSAIALSSNAPSQETYAFGTFKDLRFGRLGLGAQIIIMPYLSTANEQLYFSGLKAHITYYSNPIITLGFHRTFLSGNFDNLSSTTKATNSWTIEDAARLVIEPLFGQSKRNLSYTIPGTPGFDAWDEVLTGYIKLTFPDEHLEIYVDIASDDNRGNILDLKAHWDHTLGYMLGFKKFTNIGRWNLFTGAEYLTTRVSNTFKANFYRGGEPDNYYSKPIYDYFSYQGRRMGAHSGSSSDDLIFLFGIGNYKSMAFISWNKERHGIKSMAYTELKTELEVTYYRTIAKYHKVFITAEYEHINNFAFIEGNVSESKFLWVGYSYYFSFR